MQSTKIICSKPCQVNFTIIAGKHNTVPLKSVFSPLAFSVSSGNSLLLPSGYEILHKTSEHSEMTNQQRICFGECDFVSARLAFESIQSIPQSHFFFSCIIIILPASTPFFNSYLLQYCCSQSLLFELLKSILFAREEGVLDTQPITQSQVEGGLRSRGPKSTSGCPTDHQN